MHAIGYQAEKAGCTVLYRSVFDLFRDFLWKGTGRDPEEALN